MKLKTIFILMTILGLLIWGFGGYLDYLNHHPITMKHPFPQLTRDYPILKQIDEITYATRFIIWYEVIEKSTGRSYLAGETFFDNELKLPKVYVYDEITRIAETLTREEFFDRFEDKNGAVVFEFNQFEELLKDSGEI